LSATTGASWVAVGARLGYSSSLHRSANARKFF